MNLRSALINWFIPPGLLHIYRRVSGKTAKSDRGEIQSRGRYKLNGASPLLSKQKDKYQGQRCFILATGPSIKNQNLKILEGEHCIAVSMFHLHDDINTIKPIWHVLAPTHPPFKFDTAKIIFDSLTDRYRNHDINFLIGCSEYEYSYYAYLRQHVQEFLKQFGDSIYFVDNNESKNLDERNFDDPSTWDLEANPFVVRTVIYSAIQLANYLGFSEIILVGCDHDYLTDISRVSNHHFYPDSKAYSDKENLAAFDRERWFYEYYMRWKQYRLMKTFLAKKNVTIINATDGGMLDVFERKELSDLCQKKVSNP